MTSSATSISLTDIELHKKVVKENSDRLRQELLVGQSFFSVEKVDSMPRTDLVENVSKLRKITGQPYSVKNLIPGFDPGHISLNLPGANLDVGP